MQTASFFDTAKTSPLVRRARLVLTARRAWVLWGEAAARYQTLATEFTPDPQEVARVSARSMHLCRRYARLEAALSDASGLPPSSVYNRISRFAGVAPDLMANALPDAAAWETRVAPVLTLSAPSGKREAEARRLRAARFEKAAA